MLKSLKVVWYPSQGCHVDEKCLEAYNTSTCCLLGWSQSIMGFYLTCSSCAQKALPIHWYTKINWFKSSWMDGWDLKLDSYQFYLFWIFHSWSFSNLKQTDKGQKISSKGFIPSVTSKCCLCCCVLFWSAGFMLVCKSRSPRLFWLAKSIMWVTWPIFRGMLGSGTAVQAQRAYWGGSQKVFHRTAVEQLHWNECNHLDSVGWFVFAGHRSSLASSREGWRVRGAAI